MKNRGIVLGSLAYCGGLALLAGSAVRALVRPGAPPLGRAVLQDLDRLFRIGLPAVGLVHVSLGSFLAMQAFFMATFREATGAVVGIGLVRNLAPVMSGFVLTAVLAGHIVPELRRRSRVGLDEPPGTVPDRDVARGLRADARPEPDPARLAAVRLLAAVIAGPILALWGACVGMLIGLLVAQSMLSVSPGIYLNKFREMVALGDVTGLVLKAILFALAAALFSCHEGLRGPDADQEEPGQVSAAAGRAAVLAILVILVLNSCWFTLNHLSGDPFGPTLATR